jgi:glycosyltransferase involved in cell wall biosynthesis
MTVCAVIPAYNEASRIGAVVAGVQPYVSHIIVVDDGSVDGTADEAQRAGAAVSRLPVNRGKGLALRRGIELALLGPWSHVLLMDGDGQHLPADVPRLLAAAPDVDLVVGERQFDRAGTPRARYYSNRIGSWALSWFIGSKVRDTQSGFRVVRSTCLGALRLSARGYEIETEMLIRLAQHGATIATVPVSAVYGASASKLRPVRDTTRTCLLAVKYRYLSRA